MGLTWGGPAKLGVKDTSVGGRFNHLDVIVLSRMGSHPGKTRPDAGLPAQLDLEQQIASDEMQCKRTSRCELEDVLNVLPFLGFPLPSFASPKCLFISPGTTGFSEMWWW